MRISDWSSDVCSSDLHQAAGGDSRMNLYPAIDLKNGECVRLKQGDMAQVTVFNADPAAQARAWAAAGFRYLHQIGRAACRERVCQNGSISVVAVALKKKKKK